MKRATPVLFVGLLILAAGFLTYQAIHNPIIISFVPTLQPGIQRLTEIDGNPELLWSPTSDVIAGSNSILPCPDFWCGGSVPYSEIFLYNLESRERRTLLHLEGNSFHAVDWAPDGTRLVFSSDWGTYGDGLWLLDIENKNPPSFVSEGQFMAWNPDGTIWAIRDTIGRPGHWYPVIHLLNLNTGEKNLVFQGKEEGSSISSLTWSPSGRVLVFLYGSRRADVYRYDLDSAEISRFTNDDFDYVDAVYSPTGDLIAYERSSQTLLDTHILLQTPDGKCDFTLPIENANMMSWSPDGKRLLAANLDGVYLVNLEVYFGGSLEGQDSCVSRF